MEVLNGRQSPPDCVSGLGGDRRVYGRDHATGPHRHRSPDGRPRSSAVIFPAPNERGAHRPHHPGGNVLGLDFLLDRRMALVLQATAPLKTTSEEACPQKARAFCGLSVLGFFEL